jgi:hypothetical protein
MNNIQEKKGEFIMSKLIFNKKGERHEPIKYWTMSDNTLIAMYQGQRGSNPELDFVVKYLSPNKRLRTPSHTHWIVDLIIKANLNNINTLNFVDEWLSKYEIISPFNSIEERANYELQYVDYFVEEYQISLNNIGIYKVDFLSTLIELFIKCEKQSPNAFMFKGLLTLMKEYCEGKKDFYQVVGYSKRV